MTFRIRPARASVQNKMPSGKRSAMALLALSTVSLGGCSMLDSWFAADKPPLPGRRETVLPLSDVLPVASSPPAIAFPSDAPLQNWSQPGANPAHHVDNVAIKGMTEVWTAQVGSGSGYRQKITSTPIVKYNLVYTIDSNALVRAFDVKTGAMAWEFVTQQEGDRSTNIGGGLTSDDTGTLYAVTGRGDLIALDAAKGRQKWRVKIGVPSRSSPTYAEGKLFLTTLEQQIVAFDASNGKKLWSHQASEADTSLLGDPAPAYADGLVIGGFGSGDVIGLRAATGSVVWTDSIASASGRTSLSDLSAVTGLPVIDGNQVYVIGLGGQFVSLDLRTGRRLWERPAGGGQTPWLAGDWLFATLTSQQVIAISRNDGVVAWETQLPRWSKANNRGERAQWFGPIMAGYRLVLVSNYGKMITLNPVSGKISSVRDLSDAAAVPPIVAQGTVFVITADGLLHAYR
ncbi:outer membrane protein assembly factor BamB family protein [Granulibacter bethesdensis]|uniref:outer membrane protein assembly factor BamB family protein n=1 Tax=Granulibacter bethesdensis TaxID=364410 RepID=UPI00090A2B52|nr:PQQ-like beta-propeller repeat protein [Granulibacter bethesdensis]APH60642.1 PQQ enzyme repeat family protein [Granulibacter bethesdensis]